MIDRNAQTFKARDPGQKQLGLFGYIGSLLAAALAVYLGIRGSVWELPVAALSALLLALTLFSRYALLRVYRLWTLLGLALGWVNLRLLMALMLYLVFTLVRVVQTLAGRDPLNRKLDKTCDSYLQVRKPLSSKHYEKMF